MSQLYALFAWQCKYKENSGHPEVRKQLYIIGQGIGFR